MRDDSSPKMRFPSKRALDHFAHIPFSSSRGRKTHPDESVLIKNCNHKRLTPSRLAMVKEEGKITPKTASSPKSDPPAIPIRSIGRKHKHKPTRGVSAQHCHGNAHRPARSNSKNAKHSERASEGRRQKRAKWFSFTTVLHRKGAWKGKRMEGR